MLTIDVSSLNHYLQELKTFADKYEVAVMNIVREITNLDTEWQDENSASFFSYVSEQKTAISKFKASLDDIHRRYQQIENETLQIDESINRLFFDSTVEGKVKNKYDVSIDKVNSLLTRLSGFSTYFCTGGERSAINSAKNALSRAVKKLADSRTKVENYFNELSKLETNIKELDLSRFLRT